MKWISLLLWLAICFSAAGIGSWFTAGEIAAWYRTLERPSIAPPNWVFGPVWTLLYALMALAAWQVWLAAPSNSRTWGLSLFLVQLGLNLAWSWVFFHAHQIGFALIEVIFRWAAIGVTTLAFGRVAPVAALLMAPYWAWVTFASVLNAAYWRLNK